ncbi:hypothetical protein, partial [uncultured Thiodictyon sp.]|uniref:hypothetical protein n=1 Tax=uncultured Thiodictyon sp. TaxID=1846217 RepID=UPI0025ECF057
METQIGQLDWLVTRIEDAYARNGSWTFAAANGDSLDRLLGGPPAPPGPDARRPLTIGKAAGDDLPLGSEDDPPGFPGPPGLAGRPPPPFGPPGLDGRPPPPFADGRGPGNLFEIQPRLSLRDADGRVLAGNPRPARLAASRPIRYRGQSVGALVLLAPQTEAARDAAFLATQSRDLWPSSLAVLLLSLAAAWLLARQFLSPIQALASGARAIAQGRPAARIQVRGSDELS